METQKHNNRRLHTRYLLMVALFVIGVGVGIVSAHVYQNHRFDLKKEKYSLLADRILQSSDKDRTVSFTNLRTELKNYIDTNLNSKQYSFYFEYLPTGTSIGYNESHPLIGASLLKVPFAIQYFKAVEDGVLQPTDKVVLVKEDLDSGYGELYKRGAGYELTMDELVRILLHDSDNTALQALSRVLVDKVKITSVDQIINFIDVDYSNNSEGSTLIGAQAYSSILKCLYFSCYLNKDNSQQVLKELSDTQFNDRLKRYITDENMPIVAHKIGSFENSTQSDCGIFYEPKKPYVLCIMINEDEQQASIDIGKLSVIVNEYVKNIDQGVDN